LVKKPKLTEEEKRLLKIRKERKKREPDFVRQESWRYIRIKENWRRPRGIDSKMRLKRKGWPKCPDIGYGSPKLVRGLHPSGFREVLVYNPSQLDEIDPDKEAIRIAHAVGKKKRLEIIKKAEELGIRVLNKVV